MALILFKKLHAGTESIAHSIETCSKLIRTLVKCFACIVVFVLFLPEYAASDQFPTEYQLKAAFVYNIIKFVEWPPDVFVDREHINLCVYGNGKIVSALAPIEKKKAQAKNIQISNHNDDSMLASCNVIYLAETTNLSISNFLETAQTNHSLTISDLPGFAKSGGMLELRRQKDSIKIVVNLTASSEAGLTFSSKLLSLAIIVK